MMRLSGLVGGIVAALMLGGAPAHAVAHAEQNGVAAQDVLPLDPVSAALRDMLETRDAGVLVPGNDLAAVAEFYLQREWAPAWTLGGRLSDAAMAVIATLARADEDGLDPSAYPVPDVQLGAGIPATPDRLAEAEIALSRSVLAYVRDAMTGRVAPAKISGYISIEPPVADPVEVLDIVSSSADAAAALATYQPPHEGYRRLREKLVELRASAETTVRLKPVADGPSLRRGMRDERVVVLRRRLGLAVPESDAELFDADVHNAVIAFQTQNQLYVDGVVGPRTRAAVNGGETGDPIADVIANMERWRWLPRDLGAFHVQVNVPEFTLRIYREGRVHHQTRVIVGKRSNQTPIFSDEMEHIIVNPYWNVPRSIASKEMLPQIRQDPWSFFARSGYEVLYGGRRVDPMAIDWWNGSLRSVRIRQRPGDRNALGRIKFMFPNRHSVYLHDTPTKRLFERSVRAFSHGCVRVDDPMGFADALLVDEPEWNAAALERLFGRSSRQVNLSHHIPVHITYFTAWVDEAGKLVRAADIYGHNGKLIAALGLDPAQETGAAEALR